MQMLSNKTKISSYGHVERQFIEALFSEFMKYDNPYFAVVGIVKQYNKGDKKYVSPDERASLEQKFHIIWKDKNGKRYMGNFESVDVVWDICHFLNQNRASNISKESMLRAYHLNRPRTYRLAKK